MTGDAIYKPLIEGMTWSYSRVKCFQDCPYRFFLKYIHGSRPKPMFYSSYGKFMHKLLEQYYNGELTKEELPTRFLIDFQAEVKGERPSAQIVDTYLQAGLDYLNNFKPLPISPLSVEKRIDFNIGNNKCVGYIDLVGKRGNSIYIIDHKSRALRPRSGKSPPTAKDKVLDMMLEQLYVYAVAIEQEYGRVPNKLCFNCFKNGQFIEEPFDLKTYFRVQESFNKAIEKIKNATEFNPNIDWFSCNYICDVSDDCCYCNGGDYR